MSVAQLGKASGQPPEVALPLRGRPVLGRLAVGGASQGPFSLPLDLLASSADKSRVIPG